jgi:hypothetical protein
MTGSSSTQTGADRSGSVPGRNAVGVLSHELMKSEERRCQVYRDTGLVTAITISKGKFAGHEFTTRERASSVYIRSSSEWKCVLTRGLLKSDIQLREVEIA